MIICQQKDIQLCTCKSRLDKSNCCCIFVFNDIPAEIWRFKNQSFRLLNVIAIRIKLPVPGSPRKYYRLKYTTLGLYGWLECY